LDIISELPRFGFPTGGELTLWQTDGLNGATDAFGATLPASLQQSTGYFNAAQNQNDTQRNADKAIQFDQDVAVFKSGWGGTHILSSAISFTVCRTIFPNTGTNRQLFIPSETETHERGYNPGANYSPTSPNGNAACLLLEATYARLHRSVWLCHHSGLRFSRKGDQLQPRYFRAGTLDDRPWHYSQFRHSVRQRVSAGEGGAPGVQNRPIDFGWGDKIAPRIGAAWTSSKMAG